MPWRYNIVASMHGSGLVSDSSRLARAHTVEPLKKSQALTARLGNLARALSEAENTVYLRLTQHPEPRCMTRSARTRDPQASMFSYTPTHKTLSITRDPSGTFFSEQGYRSCRTARETRALTSISKWISRDQ
jgi:hypothetical protein